MGRSRPPKAILQRLKRAHKINAPFFVMRSSISDCAGNGLYALRSFSKGERLPFYYPGVKRSAEDIDMLNALLARITQDAVNTEKTLEMLARLWDFHVEQGQVVDRDALYDEFLAYRFNDLYWNHYYANGKIKADIDDPQCAALFMNEPGEYERFFNLFSERIQKNDFNVECRTDEQGKIEFYARRKIRQGDEMLLYYGPEYDRSAYETGSLLKPGTFKGSDNIP